MQEKRSLLSNGASIVGRNKRYVVWFYLLNLALATIGATAFVQHARPLLDKSLYSDGLVHGFDLGVLVELLARPEFGPMRASSAPAMTLAVFFFLLTMIFLPGVFLGYASDHRVSREEFFRTCGRNIWRFVRLTIMFAIVGGVVAGILFGVQGVLVKAADASSQETLSFWVQMASLIVIFVLMTVIRIWFDLAEADTVLTDQGAVRKSVGTAFRQTKKNLGGLLASYVAISIVGLAILGAGLWLWNVLVPPASVWGAFFISQLILLLLLAVRFWQRATAVSSYLRGVSEEPAEIQPLPTVVPATSAVPASGV
jgi:hypothetical protein